MQVRKLLLLALLVPSLALGTSPKDKITFVQITDAHLFDAGKDRTKEGETEKTKDKESRLLERYDTWAAWDWAFDSIQRLQKAGQNIDFLVFTGDFGLEKVTTDPDMAGMDKDTKDIRTGWPQSGNKNQECWLLADAVAAVVDKFQSLHVKKIYLVRGNNDLNDEDYTDTARFDTFAEEVAHRVRNVVNLTRQGAASEKEGRFTIVGLDSSSFKNKAVSKPPACKFEPSSPSNTPQPTADRDKYQFEELKRVSSLIKDKEAALIFTHIPDMNDPYKGNNSPDAPSWNLRTDASDVWNKLVAEKNVVAIFAGHFHDNRRLIYARPYTGQATNNNDVRTKTYVAPPLTTKFQSNKNEQSVGFVLVNIFADNAVNWQPYWVNTLPYPVAQPSPSPGSSRTKCCAEKALIGTTFILAFGTFLISLYLLYNATPLKKDFAAQAPKEHKEDGSQNTEPKPAKNSGKITDTEFYSRDS